jgi:uncharacterized protein (DUF2345 family)
MRKTVVAVVSFLLALAVSASAGENNSGSHDLASLPAAAQASISAALARDFASDESDALAGAPVVKQDKLTPSDGVKGGFFGVSVTISGNTVAVGMNSTSLPGAVYVFVKPASGWKNMTQIAKLTASDGAGNNALGYSVAISGDTIVAGAPNANGYLGAAYVFVKPASGWANMTETAKLTASDSYSVLGASVAISGNTVVVGSPDANNFLPGAAYVFVKPATGWTSMTQSAELTPSDGQTYDGFGTSVAISGNTIVTGTPARTLVYLYVEPSGGWADLTETARLTGPTLAVGSVSVGGDTVVAGDDAQGAAYVFVEPATGWTNMSPTATLTASDSVAGDWFGHGVATNGTRVVTGAPFATIGSNGEQGAAYTFIRPATGWKTTSHFNAKVIASDGAKGDQLGWSVSINGNMLLAGAPGASSQRGATYLLGP